MFAYVGGAGYVGVGRITGTMVKLRDFEAPVDGSVTKVIEHHDVAAAIRERALSADDDHMEYGVHVGWLETRLTNQAVSETGLFSSTVTVCRLRYERTIQVVIEAFGLQNT